MKWLIYNALFSIAYAAMLPSFLLRMKRRGGYRARMGDRFGKYPPEIAAALKGGAVWVHAVSVGEVQVAGQLMRAMRERDREIRFVFSTTSSTGWKTAENELAKLKASGLGRDDDVLVYNPIDFNGCVRRALDQINPRAVILTETEIWPNFIREISKRNIPLYLVNARISDHSAPRYKKLRWFFGESFRSFTKIYAQSDLDAGRITDAGAESSQIAVTGSFKFDVAHRNEAKEKELAEWIAPDGNLPPVLLGGSTWPGEDEVLLRIYSQLVKTHPDVRLIIAPRHFEKADAVEANIRAAGFECVRRSRIIKNEELRIKNDGRAQPSRQAATENEELRIKSGGEIKNDDAEFLIHNSKFLIHNSKFPIYLCDTTGEMMGLFGISTVAFVGKSLCAHGSQNMIEPCLCGKPTVVGPYTENFRPVMSDLLAADAIVQVSDEAALSREIMRFFDDPAVRAEQGARAKAAVERRCGVVGRCADELLEALG